MDRQKPTSSKTAKPRLCSYSQYFEPVEHYKNASISEPGIFQISDFMRSLSGLQATNQENYHLGDLQKAGKG